MLRATKETFLRVEKKYEVSWMQRELLINWLETHGTRDVHATKNEGYSCLSRYFDTNDLMFFNEHVEGEYIHRKLRFRTYNENKFFIEIKSKIGNLSHKQRDYIDGMVFGERVVNLAYSSPSVSRMLSHLELAEAYFICDIKYKRLPYFLNIDGIVFRINIDYELKVSNKMGGEWKLFYKESDAILEVKGPESSFEKVHPVLGIFNLSETSFSKYCRAVRYLDNHSH